MIGMKLRIIAFEILALLLELISLEEALGFAPNQGAEKS
jgi:hypothetical protein